MNAAKAVWCAASALSTGAVSVIASGTLHGLALVIVVASSEALNVVAGTYAVYKAPPP